MVLTFLAAAPADLPALKARGTLRVLVFAADEDFLPRSGSPKARDRELLAQFAEREGLTLEVVTEAHFERLFDRLLAGEADVLAHGLTVTPEREQRVAFTQPVATVKQLLVGKRGVAGQPASAAELAGRQVVVHAASAYAQTVRSLGGVVVPAPEALDSEGVLYEVSQGRLPLTVTDSNLFESAAVYSPGLQALCTVAEGKALAWAVRPEARELRTALDAFLVEKAMTGHTEKVALGDLDAIRRRGSLRVLTWNDPVSYFAYRGELYGFDYELFTMLADRLKVRLDIVVPTERSELVPWLLAGRGDLIAAGLHPFPQDGLAFSRPYAFTDELAVGKRVGAGHRPDLSDDVELVQKDQATVIDRLLADALPPPPPPLEVMATEVPIAYAVRTESKALLEAINGFVATTYQGLEYNVIRKRYFEDNRLIDLARAEDTASSGRLGPFDRVFKQAAAKAGLDWRLVAAQCFQESRFDPQAKSWAGAVGLCQLVPATAKELGVTRRDDPAQSAQAGAAYLARLASQMDKRLELKQRLRFALAAYNVGASHVFDAQRLAAERGLDPTRWFDNVEKAMLMLEQPAFHRRAKHGYCRGSEAVQYVSQIQARYERYVKLVRER